eukprot:9279275-Lingulodinium_polyedra.AAC.1
MPLRTLGWLPSAAALHATRKGVPCPFTLGFIAQLLASAAKSATVAGASPPARTSLFPTAQDEVSAGSP